MIEQIVRTANWFGEQAVTRYRIHSEMAYFETTSEPHGALNEIYVMLDIFSRAQIQDKIRQIKFSEILLSGGYKNADNYKHVQQSNNSGA